MTLTFLMIIFYFLVQVPSVQRWGVNKLTAYFEEQWGANVKIDGFRLGFTEMLAIEGLLMETPQGDTLIAIGELRCSFNAHLMSLVMSRLDLSSLYLKDVYVNLIREDGVYNYQFIVDYFKTGGSDGGKKPFRLKLEEVSLVNVNFLMDQKDKGFKMRSSIPAGTMQLNDMSLPDAVFDFSSIWINKPEIEISISEDTRDIITQKDIVEVIEDALESDTIEDPDFKILAERFLLDGGNFRMYNNTTYEFEDSQKDAFDDNYIDLNDIHIELESVSVAEVDVAAEICLIKFKTASGWELSRLQAGQFRMNAQMIQLEQFDLQTPTSHLKDALTFRFRSFSDFSEFEDKIMMDARLNESYLSMQDLFYFAPQLKNNRFFINHNKDKIVLSGRVRGRVNNLRGEDLLITLPGNTTFSGEFSGRDFSTPNETILNIEIEDLNTNIQSIKQLIPGLSLPENFNKLGRIRFSGRFDGFYEDFVTFGTLQTDLGQIKTDIQMNIVEGTSKATYRGKLEANNFNLSKWIDNDEFGRISFKAEVKNGTGLTLETVNANMVASVSSLVFRKYEYKNIQFIGSLKRNLISGKLNVKDENMDFTFDGTIDYLSEYPEFDFVSEINNLDLFALNLVNKPLTVSGDIKSNIKIRDISSMHGTASLKDVVISGGEKSFTVIDSLNIIASFIDQPYKTFELYSDILDLSLLGQYDFTSIYPAITNILVRKHPNFSTLLGIQDENANIQSNDFAFDLHLKDSRNLLENFNIPIGRIRDFKFNGNFTNQLNSSFQYEINQLVLPSFTMENVQIDSLLLVAYGNDNSSDLIFNFRHGLIAGVEIVPLDGNITLNNDTLAFNFGSASIMKSFENLDINGKFFMVDDKYHVSFDFLEFEALNNRWKIAEKNFIQFSDSSIYTRNLRFSNGDGMIDISSTGNFGALIQGNDIDIAIFNKSLENTGLKLIGDASFKAEIDNIKTMEGLRIETGIRHFGLNDLLLGKLNANATMNDTKSNLIFNADIGDIEKTLHLDGYYVLPGSDMAGKKYIYEMEAEFDHFPLKVSEFFLNDLIKDTEGTVLGKFTMKGDSLLREVGGEIRIVNAASRLAFLGTRYTIDDAVVKINNTFIDLDSIILGDDLNNKALLRGGMSHSLFDDIRMNLRISSPMFQVLNLQKGENDLFYGKAQGKIDVQIGGSFEETDITVVAETGPNSVISIPLSSAKEAQEQNFIVFINREDGTQENNKVASLKGLSLLMNVAITPDAELQLIFDERTGDIIKGSGRGNIVMELPRNGDFQMNGEFEIEKGEYPFKALVVLDKAFSVKRGGTIIWYGDPLNAYIDLEAEYKGLRTSPYNFISDYIRGDENITKEAKKPTDVDLALKLTGPLLQPAIQFDIQFPTLVGELKNYADNKLRTISADPNELNRVAIGLLAFRGFLPQASDLLSTSAISSTLSSTLTEWVTNQMRVYVNEYLLDTLSRNSFISGLDLDFGLILNPDFADRDLQELPGLGQSQFFIRPRFQLFDDRVLVDFGLNTIGNLDSETGGGFGGDINVEYAFGLARRLRLRFYSQDQPAVFGRRTMFGTGLVYRREYDTFSDIFRFRRKTYTPAPATIKTEEDPDVSGDK